MCGLDIIGTAKLQKKIGLTKKSLRNLRTGPKISMYIMWCRIIWVVIYVIYVAYVAYAVAAARTVAAQCC